ncbi:MAG: hypothetical protein AB8B83_00870 [Bdellovibrionales bacterium]
MDWQALLDNDIQTFICEHENADVKTLALKKPPNANWPYALILDQIKSRQKAKTKLPTWFETQSIIFPKPDTLEQASSEACANYKASLFKGNACVDLTGGTGIDSWAMLKNFKTADIVDYDQTTSKLIEHNLNQLTPKRFNANTIDAETFIKTMPQFDLAMIDPQRRNQNRKGIIKLEDCTPNILECISNIKAKHILLKTSPMLDINQAIDQLEYVQSVHIVEWDSECKELLFIIKPNKKTNNIPITAAKINNSGQTLNTITFNREDELTLDTKITPPQSYLYEPSPAFMKAGCHKTIAKNSRTQKIHINTNLHTSTHYSPNFPGRVFKIINTYKPQAKAIPFKKANLSVRNFPLETHELKKKLKLKDGGDDYLFACTTVDPKTNQEIKTLIHCRKSDNRNNHSK